MEDHPQILENPQAALRLALQALMAGGRSDLLSLEWSSNNYWRRPDRELILLLWRWDGGTPADCAPAAPPPPGRGWSEEVIATSSTLTLSSVDNCLPIQTISKIFIIILQERRGLTAPAVAPQQAGLVYYCHNNPNNYAAARRPTFQFIWLSMFWPQTRVRESSVLLGDNSNSSDGLNFMLLS